MYYNPNYIHQLKKKRKRQKSSRISYIFATGKPEYHVSTFHIQSYLQWSSPRQVRIFQI